MGKHVKLSASNNLELPSDLVSKNGWLPGTEFEVVETAYGFAARRVEAEPGPKKRFDYEEFRRRVPKHEGPPATLEDMARAIDQGRRERWARKERDSRG